MLQIPIQPEPSQIVKAVLGSQNCQINIYLEEDIFFFDINSNGTDIVIAVRILNAVPLVCIQYTGFQGNLIFIDTQGTSDPNKDSVTELGTRYQLIYLEADEYALIV